MKLAITGANGFVGSHIKKSFKDCITIGRNDSEDEILSKLNGVDVVINLAGSPIVKRWTKEYKKTLIDSRIQSTKKLVNAINRSDVKHLISTSAIGAYPSDRAYDESFDGYSDDFLGSLTKEWEYEAKKCNKLTSIVRMGIILGNNGGALVQMLPAFRMGVGGIISDGKMMVSWVDIDDVIRIYKFIFDKELTGVFNATTPNPITNYMFTKALGSVLSRPTVIPVPEFVLKLLFGEGSTVLTGSKEVYPKALTEAGFEFKYKEIESSFRHLLI